MTLPRFLDRVLDAAVPVLGGLDRVSVRDRLETTGVTLRAGTRATRGAERAGLLLATNLCARTYPRICLDGPVALVNDAKRLARAINPEIDIPKAAYESDVVLGFEADSSSADISVSARGWNVFVDRAPEGEAAAEAPASLAAAALGVGEVFRVVFGDELGSKARQGARPAAWNLVTLGEPADVSPAPAPWGVGCFRLVGAGAIGQAAALTVREARVRGTLLVVDHEDVSLSNLQRYVLTSDTDVGAKKVDLLKQQVETQELTVVPVSKRWDVSMVEGALPTLVAVDSAEARIGVQASLPGPIYNAWTQPADIGWSRHEAFGTEPCLACLYWPDRERPSRHEEIAAAFHQHPLRILAYLVHRSIPVGLPLPPGAIPAVPGTAVPADAAKWTEVPLLQDIAEAAGMGHDELEIWRERPLADLYQEGICGGALLHLQVGEVPRDVVVPLPHQSALAGIMLATQFLVAQAPGLKDFRPTPVEGRFDVLAGFPQAMPRPRARTARCICEDPVFLQVYRAQVDQAAVGGGANASP